MELLQRVDKLIECQLKEWDLASANYSDLENVKSRTLHFPGFDIMVQFNPKRMVSSSAKVDAKSIGSRPCFLCSQNRPEKQHGIMFKQDYMILVNPFPIFPKHLTIPMEMHTDQLINGHFEDMLDLAAALNSFVVFYNGPKCGASAPDHFHFQAGSKGFLPIEKDFQQKLNCALFADNDLVKRYQWTNYARTVLTFQSSHKENLTRAFNSFVLRYSHLRSDETEPMMNIVAYMEKDGWIVHLFPRSLHRPEQYFATGDKQILLSPASVDLGGVLITPREEDFLKITVEDVADIFRQVCLDNAALSTLMTDISFGTII